MSAKQRNFLSSSRFSKLFQPLVLIFYQTDIGILTHLYFTALNILVHSPPDFNTVLEKCEKTLDFEHSKSTKTASQASGVNYKTMSPPGHYLYSLCHVSDDAISQDEENEVTRTISVCAGKPSHMVYNWREVGRSIKLHLTDAVPVSF
jgi:hypothetical protein